MADLEWGPVEILLIEFDGETPGPGVVDAITELIDAGTVRLLDLLFVSRAADGTVSALEWELVRDEYGFGEVELELEAVGLAGEEDVAELAEMIDPGTSAALLVVELTWAKNFASQVIKSQGRVVYSERIPAEIVNAAAAEAFVGAGIEE